MTALERPNAVSVDLRGASSIMHKDATLHLELKGTNLTNVATGFFSNRTSTPVFHVCSHAHRRLDDWQPVATSESVGTDLNPHWPMLRIRCQDLCHCDLERPIRILVLDQGQQQDAAPVEMGHLDSTVRELLNRHTAGNPQLAFPYDLIQNGKAVGKISVVSAMIEIETPEQKQKDPKVTTSSLGPQQSEGEEEEPGMLGKWRRHLSLGNPSSPDQEGAPDLLPSPPPARHRKQTTTPPKATQPQRFCCTLRGINLEEMPGRRTLGMEELNPVAASRCCTLGKFQPGVDNGTSPFRQATQTMVIPHDQNPTWEELTLTLDELCGGDLDLPILISALEEGRTVMGSCQTTARELLRMKSHQTMTLMDNRRRNFGQVAVVKAELTSEQEEDIISEEETPVLHPVPNWLARTLNLAAGIGLVQSTNHQEDPPIQEVEESSGDEESDKDKENNHNQNKARMDSSLAKMARVLHQEEEEEEESSEESDNGNQSSYGSDSDDEITIADVISVAEESIARTENREHREGLLELTQLLSPKPKVPKLSAESILGNMPDWTMDGDSAMDDSSSGNAHQRATLQPAAIPRVYKEEEFDATAYMLRATAKQAAEEPAEGKTNEELDKADDSTGGGDDAIPKRHEALRQEALMLAQQPKAKGRKSRKAKRRVQKTLKSIHRILTDNLRSIPEETSPEEEDKKGDKRTIHETAGEDHQISEMKTKKTSRRETPSARSKSPSTRERNVRSRSPSRRRSRVRHPPKVWSVDALPSPPGEGVLGSGSSGGERRNRSTARTRPTKSRSQDTGLFEETKRKSRVRRSPQRSVSHDGDTSTVGHTKRKGGRKPRQVFQDGHTSFEKLGLELTKQLVQAGASRSVSPANSPNQTRNIRQADALHESYPSPKPSTKKRAPRRRYSLSDGVNLVKDSAKGVANSDVVKGIGKSVKGAVKASANGVLSIGQYHHQEVDGSLELRQATDPFEDPQNLFEPNWASFPSQAEKPIEENTPEKKERKKGMPSRRYSLSGGLNRVKDGAVGVGKNIRVAVKAGVSSIVKHEDSPLEYLVANGLSEAEAQAVIDAVGVDSMKDLTLFDEDVLSEVAKEAGLKIVPTRKLSNAISSYQLQGASQPEMKSNKSGKKGGKKISDAAAKVMGGTVKATQIVGKGVGVAGKATFSATKTVAKGTVRVGKGTVGAVANLPGNAAGVAGRINPKSSKSKAPPSAPGLAERMGEADRQALPSLNIWAH